MEREYRPRRPRRHKKPEKKPLLDLGKVVRFILTWATLSLIAFGVKKIIMTAFAASPTGQVGNGILTLYEVHNTGAAFNLFAGHQEMIVMASFFAIAIISFVVIMTSTKQSNTAVAAMGALCAGITMNMLERIKLGYVIDYIYCEFAPNVPMFNVPDIYIVVGAVCLILSVLTRR